MSWGSKSIVDRSPVPIIARATATRDMAGATIAWSVAWFVITIAWSAITPIAAIVWTVIWPTIAIAWLAEMVCYGGTSCKSESAGENIGEGALALDGVPTRHSHWVWVVNLASWNGNWSLDRAWVGALSSILLLMVVGLGHLVGVDIMVCWGLG